MSARRFCLLILVVLGSTPTLASQTRRDSAGVQIVENAAPVLAAARAWRVDPKPILVIGGETAATAGDSLYDFERVMGIARLARGEWAVSLPTFIRFYDANGRYLRTAGRAGDGPGEFRQIMGLRLMRGDTLVITDNSEVEYYTSDGKFVSQGASRRTTPGTYIWPQAVFADGSYAGMNQNDRSVVLDGRVLQRMPLLRVSRDGTRFDTLSVLPMREAVFTGRPGMQRQIVYSPFALMAARNDRLFYTYPVSGEVLELTEAGRAVRISRLDLKPRSVTSADQDEYKNWMLDLPGEDGRPVPARLREQRAQGIALGGFATTFPVHSMILTDRSGDVWLRRFDVRQQRYKPGPVLTLTVKAPSLWDVVDSTGRWLCTLETPPSFTPLDIGTDYVVGVAHDSDDVESIHVYRIVKP